MIVGGRAAVAGNMRTRRMTETDGGEVGRVARANTKMTKVKRRINTSHGRRREVAGERLHRRVTMIAEVVEGAGSAIERAARRGRMRTRMIDALGGKRKTENGNATEIGTGKERGIENGRRRSRHHARSKPMIATPRAHQRKSRHREEQKIGKMLRER